MKLRYTEEVNESNGRLYEAALEQISDRWQDALLKAILITPVTVPAEHAGPANGDEQNPSKTIRGKEMNLSFFIGNVEDMCPTAADRPHIRLFIHELDSESIGDEKQFQSYVSTAVSAAIGSPVNLELAKDGASDEHLTCLVCSDEHSSWELADYILDDQGYPAGFDE